MNLIIQRALAKPHAAQFIFTGRPKLVYPSSEFLLVQLAGLSVEESRRLFEVSGVVLDPVKGSEKIAAIHALTQGHPLALNLVASQVAKNKVDLGDLINKVKSGIEAGIENPVLPNEGSSLPTRSPLLTTGSSTVFTKAGFEDSTWGAAVGSRGLHRRDGFRGHASVGSGGSGGNTSSPRWWTSAGVHALATKLSFATVGLPWRAERPDTPAEDAENIGGRREARRHPIPPEVQLPPQCVTKCNLVTRTRISGVRKACARSRLRLGCSSARFCVRVALSFSSG